MSNQQIFGGTGSSPINPFNYLVGDATSVNASTEDLITIPMGLTGAVYRFEFQITGRDTITGDGVGYHLFASAKTNGITATVISTPFLDNDEDTSLLSASVDFVASGNNLILQVTGETGQTIIYKAIGQYVRV